MSKLLSSASQPRRIGFVSTRFHGTDGVTLEARKWAHILKDMGHESFWMAGLLDAPPDVSYEAPLAFSTTRASPRCRKNCSASPRGPARPRTKSRRSRKF